MNTKQFLMPIALLTVVLSLQLVFAAVPVATNDAYTTNEDTALVVAAANGVLANDTDADAGTVLTAIKVTDPLHGAVILNADGRFTYTPTANYNGADSFTYKANDGTDDSNVATVTITIIAVNDAPVATNDAYTTNEDTALTIAVAAGVLANDVDVDTDAVLTATKIVNANPLHGTLVLNADGSFTYTPTADYNGADSFTYKANDGTSDSNVATVSLTVAAVNDAPVITVPQGITYMTEGQVFTLDVVVIDVDAGDTKTFLATPTVAWPRFAINAQTGQISFTPTAAEVGAHLVDITITDAAGLTDTETFRFYVAEACTSTAILLKDVKVEDATGEDDELLPGDYLEAEFDAKNTLQEDLSDVKVSAWIENLGDGESFSSTVESKKQDIDSTKSKSLLLKLRLDLDVARTENIKSTPVLYIRAEGDDKNGTAQCSVYQKDLIVDRLADDLLINSVIFSPAEPVCGGSVSISTQVFDIGRSSPDDVTLHFKNSALSLDRSTGAFELASSGRDAKATKSVDFVIPDTAKAGDYPVEVTATFNDGEDVESLTSTLKVGACEAPTLTAATGAATAQASASTSTIAVSQSTAVAKREETVKYTVTLTNTQATAAAYQFDLTGIADWASGSVEPQDITLGAGASMPVYVYLTPNDDAKGGEHTATLSVKSGATVVDSKTLTTNVQAPTTTVTEFGNGSAALRVPFEFGKVNRDSALFGVLFIVVLVFAGFLYARDRGRKASKVEVIRE